MKTALCTIVKLENKYIREYVAYYKQLGVNNIYLYDNNEPDGESLNDAINDYIADGFVVIIDFRGRKKAQVAAYQDFYDKYGDSFDWILYFDADEFLTFSNHSTINNITEYLQQKKFEAYNMIHLNWMCYGDNEKLHYEAGAVIERFPKPLPYSQCVAYDIAENSTIKSIVRGHNNIKWKNKSVHTPFYVENVNCCNNKGEKIEKPYTNMVPYDFTEAYIRHYSTKTAEEYAMKMKRGFADQAVSKDFITFLIENRFFATNVKTEEKVKVFEEKLPFLKNNKAVKINVNDKLLHKMRKIRLLIAGMVIAFVGIIMLLILVVR